MRVRGTPCRASLAKNSGDQGAGGQGAKQPERVATTPRLPHSAPDDVSRTNGPPVREDPMTVHLAFDLLAMLASLGLSAVLYRWRLREIARPIMTRAGPGYALALVGGAIVGGYGLGTLNLMLSDVAGIGRSILGALAGAIAGVELFKAWRNLEGSTGLIFVGAFCTSVAVGRIGCLLSGLDDQTYGIPTSLPWAVDQGDGIGRHPVQAYEALAMLAFLAFFVEALRRRAPLVMARGFYLLVGYYAAQRFLWEFLKPYAKIIGSLNVFHLACLALLTYAGVMLWRNRDVRA